MNILNTFTIGGFLELLKISSIFVLLLTIILKVDRFICSIGTNILFVASVIFGLRFLIPFQLPITFEIKCPFLTPAILNIFSIVVYKNIQVYHLVLFVWFLVAAIKIAKLYTDYKKFTCLLWTLSKTNQVSSSILKTTLSEFDLKNNVTIVISKQVKYPFVVGFKEVFIALPHKEYSAINLKHIITHEINHVRHHDFLWKSFFEFLSALYWWFPIINIFKKLFFKLLEIRNDIACTHGMVASKQYSYLSCILEESVNVEGGTNNKYVLPFSVFSKSFLHQRFSIILNEKNKSNVKMQLFMLALLVTLLILSISISLAPLSI